MRRFFVYLAMAGVVLGCAGAPRGRRAGGVRELTIDVAGGGRVESLRLVPPAPGECTGRIEATVVNECPTTVTVGGLRIIEGAGTTRDEANGPPFGEDGPLFTMFATVPASVRLAPGSSCVVGRAILRSNGGPSGPVEIRGPAPVPAAGDAADRPTAPPLETDLAEWPLPRRMSGAALDGALAAGNELRIAFCEAAMPGGGWRSLEIEPDGLTRGDAGGRLSGHRGFGPFRRAGRLLSRQIDELRAAVRAAPFAGFRVDPVSLETYDGDPVRLMVAAGPTAFLGSTQLVDFQASGLEPLLDHLRALLRELPEVDADR